MDTNYGVNHPLAIKKWSSELMVEALKKTYVLQFMGKGTDNLVTIKTDLTTSDGGDRIRVGIRSQLRGDGVSGDNTLEGNEEPLETFYQDVMIDQLRHAVRSKGKMSEQRVPFSVREECRMGLSDWYAAKLVEERRVQTAAPPVFQARAGLFAHRERHALLAHLAGAAHSVAELVDDDGVAVGCQRFFVAFQRAVALDAVTGQLHAQAHGDLVASALGGLILDLDDGAGGLADELGEVGLLERFLEQLLAPELHCEGVVYAIGGACHDWPFVSGVGLLGACAALSRVKPGQSRRHGYEITR